MVPLPLTSKPAKQKNPELNTSKKSLAFPTDDAMKNLHKETRDKVANGYNKFIQYRDMKKNLPAKLKISPVAMIPHTSRFYQTILDL